MSVRLLLELAEQLVRTLPAAHGSMIIYREDQLQYGLPIGTGTNWTE